MRCNRRISAAQANLWVALTVALAMLAWPATGLAAPGLTAASRIGPAPTTQVLQLVLPLEADDSGLRRFAEAVTTPGSPDYAQYESIPWLARHFGASQRIRRAVARFLRRSGARHVRIDATGLFADATLTSALADRLFRTSLAEFHATRGGSFAAPAAGVHLPAGLRGLVTGVVGLNTRVLAVPAQAYDVPSGYVGVTGTPRGCAAGLSAGGFAPNQYLAAYDYTPLQAAGIEGQGERVALIEIDGFRASDISTFANCFGLHQPPIQAFGVGVNQALPPGGESTLDLEVLDAAAPDLRAIDVYESNAQAADVLEALTAPLQNPGYKPDVISASLGLCEAQTEEAVGRSGINATEAALEEAAASGISFAAAAGDDGSADCVQSDNPNALPLPELAVNYPASSPWVTGVGGTNFKLNFENQITWQAVWNDGSADPGAAGGGGFSALFSRPSYQDGTVAQNHRAVPDLALLADVAPGDDLYCTAQPDCINADNSSPWQSVGGTSAATPLLAGGLALVDQLLRIHQLQDLGLINPLLYRAGRDPAAAAAVFYDVTEGDNDVGPYIQPSGRPLGCCTAGVGFDEASGWGGIDLAAFSTYALSVQPKIVDVSLSLPGGQRPIASRHILAKVTCSGACLLGAFARVTIGHAKPFTVYSDVYHLSAKGSKTIKVSFSKAELKKLKAALAGHTKVSASVRGAIVDPAGNIERETAALVLALKH